LRNVIAIAICLAVSSAFVACKKDIPVRSVELDQRTTTLVPGEVLKLKAVVKPSNATNNNVSWTSSNKSVATVTQSGVVTAIAVGIAVITVITEDGNKEDDCIVTVTPEGGGENEDIPVIIELFKNTKGIIIDFRGNFQENYVAYYLNSYFLSQTTEYDKLTIGSIEQPGMFTFSKPSKVGNNNNEQSYKGKVVIIVNEQTKSGNENIIMAAQTAPQVAVIGSVTAASAGYGSNLVLPGNVWAAISGFGVYYPDGREAQRVGIALDMEVKPTIRGIINGRDEVLEKAMEIIQK